MICPNILREDSLSGAFFAFTSTAPIAATMIRFITRDITVAMATPITPQFMTNKNTEFKIKLIIFPVIDAKSDCLV